MSLLAKTHAVSRRGWHFLPTDRKVPRLGTLVVEGLVEEHSGDLKPCVSGLHFSERLIDALQYALGSVLHEVEVSGSIVMDTDKGVASRRTTLWIDDVEPMLFAFARWCALSVVDKWKAPQIVLCYLRDGREKDRDAAWDDAWDAARDTARDAQEKQALLMLSEFRAGKREWIFP